MAFVAPLEEVFGTGLVALEIEGVARFGRRYSKSSIATAE
jgi:hypothetical protein